MKYEIEFLPVGNAEKSGNAILIRWEELQDNYKVMVVDGGIKESSKKIVEHIKTYYDIRKDSLLCRELSFITLEMFLLTVLIFLFIVCLYVFHILFYLSIYDAILC